MTRRYDDSLEFYRDVFGFEYRREADMGGGEPYRVLQVDGQRRRRA